MDTKLKKLLTTWPQGTVCLSSELKRRGIGYDLQRLYRNSGWIISVGQGAVIRNGDNVSWPGATYALQSQAKLPIHVGAKTALTLFGLTHFLKLANERIQVFGPPASKLPGWFKNFKWGSAIEYYRSSLFESDEQLGIQSHSYGTFNIDISSPERAFFELLDLVPKTETFNEASLISESLSTFRPKLVQQLLENCNSIKVKRLLLYFAEKQNHQWFGKLDHKKIKLGKGDRQLVKGGLLDPKYRITVPEAENES